MKKRRILAAWAALAAGLAIMAAPIAAKQPGANAGATQGSEVWLKAVVLHADGHTIAVRERANMSRIHTFTYSPAVREKMLKILNHGGYRPGDKVKIRYQQGQTVALKIVGKPSKPH